MENTLVGVARVVQEVWERDRARGRSSTLVVNGLLPRGRSPLENNVDWQKVEWINERLECMTRGVPNLVFYNATPHFVVRNDSNMNATLMVNRQHMKDYVHPSIDGFRVWAADMLSVIHNLLR